MRLVDKLTWYNWQEYWDGDEYFPFRVIRRTKTTKRSKAELIGSRVLGSDSKHLLALDIDLPLEVYPSKTTGHYHVIIGKEMTWRQKKRILRALAAAGVLEKSWVKAALKDREVYLAVGDKL